MHVHTEGNLPRNRKVESLIACITLVTATIYFFTFFLTKIYQYNINYYLHKTASINGTLIVNGSVINIKSEKTFNTYTDLIELT